MARIEADRNWWFFSRLFKSTYCHWQGERPFVDTRLPRHLENDFQLDRGAEWKACDAVN